MCLCFRLLILLTWATRFAAGRTSLYTCKTSSDCSLNGDCVKGVCKCDAPWTEEPTCDVLAVLPAEAHAGYRNESAASWGGNALFEDGKYHLFVAEMVNHCGLESWGTNSAIVRAEAASPAGPFVHREVVLAPEAHNPTVRRIPRGKGFVIFFTGAGGSQNIPACGSASGPGIDRASAKLARSDHTRMSASVSGSVHVLFSRSIYGPWTSPIKVEFEEDNVTDWGAGFSNPSPHIAGDGTVTLALQRRFNPNPGKELLGVARASSWRGPFRMITPKPVEPEKWFCVAGTGEDPFLWRSQRGWHIIWHGMCPTGVVQARYAFSNDGVHWTVSSRQTYSYTVHFADGSKHLFARVERPQLFFEPGSDNSDFEGRPSHLYNGVCWGGNLYGIYQCLELQKGPVMTWTLVRPLKASATQAIAYV